MMRTIQWLNKALIALMVITLSGCVKEEVISFSPENRDWMVDNSVGSNFVLMDDNGISHELFLTEDSYYFLEGSGGFLFFTTHRYSREYHYKVFSSTYAMHFSVSLTAGSEPFGDELFIEALNTGFAFDLKQNKVTRVEHVYDYLWLGSDDEQYSDNVTIHSVVTILESYTVNGAEYSDVLHFTLNDFSENWEDYTVKELFFAKRYGLVKLVFNNGLTFSRS